MVRYALIPLLGLLLVPLAGETPPGLAALTDDGVYSSPKRNWDSLGIRTWELRVLERVKTSGGIYAFSVAYKSGDLGMTAFLARPNVTYDSAGEAEQSYPAVILNHDGRQGITPPWREIALEFARKGYVAAASTFRGQRGLEGGTQGRYEYAKGEVLDMLQLTQLVRKLDYVDSLRIAVIGEGHGASITAQSIGRSNVYRCAIVASPMLFSASAEHRYAGLQRFRSMSADLLGRNLPEGQLYGALRSREAFADIEKIESPVLVLASGADPGLPETLQWVEALSAKGIENRLLRYPAMFPGFLTAVDNGLRPPEWQQQRDNAWTNIFNWVDHYLANP